MNDVMEILKASMEDVFGSAAGADVFFAPGRVNLIGEHIDYNGGHVFPCALTIGTYAAGRRNGTGTMRLYSANFPGKGVVEFGLDTLDVHQDSWADYPKGVMWALKQHGFILPADGGMDIVYYGNIPNGSGLSSSASIEVLTATLLSETFGFGLDGVYISRLCKESENKYNGVNCGIMDQFAIAMGAKDKAIFLDTATLDYTYVPFVLPDAKIVIACSNKKRGLADSEYNKRRGECEAALADLNKVRPIKALCDLGPEEFETIADAIEDPVNRKRAKHAVTENARTVQAVEALNRGDLEAFGKLMKASHDSLRYDFEVTGRELDALYVAACAADGVIGTRMTGAGFGGCTVSIVRNDCVDAFIESVGAAYREAIGYGASFYAVNVGDGPAKIASFA